MRFDPSKHHRRSIRLQGFDYAQPGAYYVTIVVQEREPLFGQVVGERVELNDAGAMAERWWRELATRFANAEIDEFVVMPNHFHGVLMIVDRADGHAGPPLPTVVGWFKTMTTNEYIRGVSERGWVPFTKRLWQRGYYERVIRSETELARIREYITTNPLRWDADRENPARRPQPAQHLSDDIEAIVRRSAPTT